MSYGHAADFSSLNDGDLLTFCLMTLVVILLW